MPPRNAPHSLAWRAFRSMPAKTPAAIFALHSLITAAIFEMGLENHNSSTNETPCHDAKIWRVSAEHGCDKPSCLPAISGADVCRHGATSTFGNATFCTAESDSGLHARGTARSDRDHRDAHWAPAARSAVSQGGCPADAVQKPAEANGARDARSGLEL